MKKLILPILAALFLTACGERVEVPPAHVGKILTRSGFQPEVIPPSKFRLPECVAYCDKLVLVEVSDQSFKLTMQLFMPKDELNISFDVRGQASISDNPEDIHRIFDKIIPSDGGTVKFDQVFDVYAISRLRTVARSHMAQYSIAEIVSNRETIGAELSERLKSALTGTPINIGFVDLADVQYPDIITEAKIAAKEREVAIGREENERKIALIKAETELQLAEKNQAVRLKRAETIKLENELVAESVTDRYLSYRALEVQEAMAENQAAVFMPFEAMGSFGAQNRMFSKEPAK